MNWRRLLLLYAAKVLDEIGNHHLARLVRSTYVPLLEGGGLRILQYGEVVSGRLYGALPNELPDRYRHGVEIAFVIPLDVVPEEKLYYRPVLPEWAQED
jgi:hypothetical protein